MTLQKSEKTLEPGDTAPDFTLKNVDGSMVSLSDFEDEPVCIIFMCNHCPYVQAKMDEIADLQSFNVPIICINSNDADQYPEDSFENMQDVAEEQGYRYYLRDASQDVARAYGAVCTPDPFVFDDSHELVYHGRINNAMKPDDTATEHDLREVLEKVDKGESIEDWFRPSMGCNIKWKD
ncbi:MAG: thioredoxin family protein [Halobacteriaceae archaeon]